MIRKSTKAKKSNEVELVFLPSETFKGRAEEEVSFKDEVKEFSAKISDLKEWFKGFKVDTIELWLEGGIKSEGVLKLFVSLEGKGGCKVTLKPV